MVNLYKNTKILILSGLLLSSLLISGVVVPQPVSAQPSGGDTPYTCYNNNGNQVTCPGASTHNFETGGCYRVIPENQGRYNIAKISCPNANTDAEQPSFVQPGFKKNDCNSASPDSSNCGIIRYLVIFINILSAMAGVVITGSLIWAGIQYSMAGSDPQKVSSAKDRIRNAIIALLFFIFGYGLLNYLIPGGVL